MIVVRLHVSESRDARSRKSSVMILNLTEAASFDALPPCLKQRTFVCLKLTGFKHEPVYMLEVVCLISTAGFLDSNLKTPRISWAFSSVRELASVLYVSHPHHRFLIAALCRCPHEHHRLRVLQPCQLHQGPCVGGRDVTHLTYIDGRGSIDVER